MSGRINRKPDNLILPYGERLTDLLIKGEEAQSLKEEARYLPPITLTTNRQLSDFELLVIGGLSPLKGFMPSKDYKAVVKKGTLADGTLWPIPIVLDVDYETARRLTVNRRYALNHLEGYPLGVITVTDIYEPDKYEEAINIYETDDPNLHPGVDYLFNKTGPVYVGGNIQAFQLPRHYTFKQYRLTPQQVREEIARRGFGNVVAFQTRNPTHRGHYEIMLKAMEEYNAALLLHPTVGPTKANDVEDNARMRIYEAITRYFPDSNRVILAALPKAMRFAGPREALWDAIIRRNYGATHFIVGRDHAGVNGVYDPSLAQITAKKYEEVLGITIVVMPEMVYVEEEGKYVPLPYAEERGYTPLTISGTELREIIRRGNEVPSWYIFPEVAIILRRAMAPRTDVSALIEELTMELVTTGTIQHKIDEILAQPTPEPTPNDEKGFIVWLTGLSGAGKTTIARILEKKLLEIQVEYDNQRPVTVLDGDKLRHTLSKGLGFSREDRHENVLRAAYLAAKVASANEAVVCAFVSPYAQSRDTARAIAEKLGVGFIEVYVKADLETLVKRDAKGLYEKALAGEIKNFTGVNDPYEPPKNPELTIDTTQLEEEKSADLIISYLKEQGYITI